MSCQTYVNRLHIKLVYSVVFDWLFPLVYSLEPYTVNTKELLADEAIKKYLAKVSIVTDKQRLQANNSGNVVQPEDRSEGTWYYPETTKNYDNLPSMYKGKTFTAEDILRLTMNVCS